MFKFSSALACVGFLAAATVDQLPLLAVEESDPLLAENTQLLVSLSSWVPAYSLEISTKTIQLLDVMDRIHSRGIVRTYDGRLIDNMSVQGTLKAINEELTVVLRRVVARVAKSALPVPPELALCISKTERYLGEYQHGILIDILNRMLPTERRPGTSAVDDFNRRLTLEELIVDREPGVEDIKSCLPRIYTLQSGPWFVRTSHSVRMDGVLVAKAWGPSGKGLNILASGNPILAIRHSAILDILKNVEGVARNAPTISGLSIACTAHTAVSLTHVTDRSLAAIEPGKVSVRFLTRFAKRAIEILRSIHEKGFIHGSIGIESFVFAQGGLKLDPTKVQLSDFSYATSWVQPQQQIPVRPLHEPLAAKSVFELEGNPPSRLDDLYRLAELLLQLSGQPKFDPVWWEKQDLDLEATIAAKTGIRLDTKDDPPLMLVALYTDVKDLQYNDEPLYDMWLDGLSLQAK